MRALALLLVACAGAGAEPSSPDLRACSADADCVVAPSLAGLDHAPASGETCGTSCFVGVRADQAGAWSSLVREHAGKVPCDLEMEPCPPIEHWAAACVQGACVARYAPKPAP